MDLWILIFFMVASLVTSWFIRPRFLFWVMAIFYACFGGMEIFSTITSGESISTNVSLVNATNPLIVTLFCGSFIGIAIALTIHFKIKRK